MLTRFKHFFKTSKVATVATIAVLTTSTLSTQAHADSETNALIAGSLLGLAVGLSVDSPTREVHRTTVIERTPSRYNHSFYREREHRNHRRYRDERRIHRRYSTSQQAYHNRNEYPNHPHKHYSTQHRDTRYHYEPQRVKETQITIRETLPASRPDTGKRIIIR